MGQPVPSRLRLSLRSFTSRLRPQPLHAANYLPPDMRVRLHQPPRAHHHRRARGLFIITKLLVQYTR